MAGVAHQSEQTPRINTRREKNPDLDIGQNMCAHTIGDAGTQPFKEIRGRRGLTRAFGEDHSDIRKGRRLPWTGGVDPLTVASGQRPYLAIERERLGDAAEQVEANEARRLRVARYAAASEKRLHLRGEAEGPAVV